MRSTTTTLVAVAAVVMAWPTESRAAASCSRSCSSTICQFNCSSEAEYVVFGKVYESGTYKNIGVCFFDSNGAWSKGTCRGCVYANVTSGITTYAVLAGAGVDVIRLAETDSDGEACSGTNYTIKGDMPDTSDTYQFWGEGGGDAIMMCQNWAPEAGMCLDNLGEVWGGSGADYIWGSYNDDYIECGEGVYGDAAWGGDGNDEINGGPGDDALAGEGGDDWVGGLEGNDQLWGGTGDDTVEGYTGNDILYGGYGCDNLDGGSQELNRQDQCTCGEVGETSNTAWWWGDCEVQTRCYTCLLLGEESAEAGCGR